MTTAVLDRFEGQLAVLVLNDGQALEIPRNTLPRGTKEGDYLAITIENGRINDIQIDRAATDEARNRIEAKLNKLRRGEHLTKDE